MPWTLVWGQVYIPQLSPGVSQVGELAWVWGTGWPLLQRLAGVGGPHEVISSPSVWPKSEVDLME